MFRPPAPPGRIRDVRDHVHRHFFKILILERNSLKVAHFLKFNVSRINKSHVHDVKISSTFMPDIKHPKCTHPQCGANMQRLYKRNGSLFVPIGWVGTEC